MGRMGRSLVLVVGMLTLACGSGAGGEGTGDAASDAGSDLREVGVEIVEVRADATESPAEVVEVRADAMEPPAEVVEVRADAMEPPAEVVEVLADAMEPPAEVVDVGADAMEPPAEVVEVHADAMEPPAEVVDVGVDAMEPPVEVVDVGVDAMEPPVEVVDVGVDASEADAGPGPSVYPTFAEARFDGVPLQKRVPGIRLLLSYSGDDGDAATCGATTWRLGNRVVLTGESPDGIPRGRLTGATLYVDVDEQDPDLDVYPTADGELRPYPFAVDVLDAEHRRLWRGRLREPVQIREYVARAMEEKASTEFSPLVAPLVSSVLQADLEALSVVVPALPDARYLQFSRDLSAAERLALAADSSCALDPQGRLVLPIDAGNGPVDEVALDAVPEVPLSIFHDLAPGLEVTRLWGTADPADAVNVAILADGFQAAEKGAFETHAQAVAEALLAHEPYASLAPRVNVWRVWTPSAESGVAYDCDCPSYGAPGSCTDPTPACKDGLRDTMYGSDFVLRSVMKLLGTPPDPQADRMIVPLRLARVALAMSVSAEDGTPVSADAAFVLANDAKEAAFGLFYAAVTTSFAATDGEAYLGEVATHEFGHAFGLLGDEYHVSSDVCQVFELTPLFPNFSPIGAGPDDLAWAPWVSLDGPYPNTTDQGTADDVGCFVPAPGGGLCADDQGQPLVCRPQKTCKMKTNSGELCAVCRDHVLKRLFARVDLLADPLFALDQLGPTTFRLAMGVSDDAVTTTWRVDGAVVQQTPAFAPLELDVAALGSGAHGVLLEVTHATPLSRLWTAGLTERAGLTVTVP